MIPQVIITKLSCMSVVMAVRSVSILIISPLYKEVNCITEILSKLY